MTEFSNVPPGPPPEIVALSSDDIRPTSRSSIARTLALALFNVSSWVIVVFGGMLAFAPNEGRPSSGMVAFVVGVPAGLLLVCVALTKSLPWRLCFAVQLFLLGAVVSWIFF